MLIYLKDVYNSLLQIRVFEIKLSLASNTACFLRVHNPLVIKTLQQKSQITTQNHAEKRRYLYQIAIQSTLEHLAI